MGPRTDPWGTPLQTGMIDVVQTSNCTHWVWDKKVVGKPSNSIFMCENPSVQLL